MATRQSGFTVVQAVAVFAVIVAAGVVWSQPQQAPTTPTVAPTQQQMPLFVQAPPVQDVDPPDPRPGEGVNFTVRVIDGTTGQALSGAALELKRIMPPQARDAAANADRRRWTYKKMADADGVVQFSNVMPDRYSMAPPQLTGYAANAGPQAAATNYTFTVGARPEPVLFRMWKASFVDGIVEDGEGNPVAGAAVQILEEGWTGGLRVLSLAQAVQSDKTGKFVMEAVLPGTYYLRAMAPAPLIQQQLKASKQPNEKPSAFVDTLFPRAIYFENAAPLNIVPGVNVFGLRIEMHKSPYYTLNGRVFGIPEGRASGLVLIRRVSFDSPFPFIWASPYAGSIGVSLDREGRFTAPNVPPGPYWAGYTPAGEVRGGMQFVIQDRDIDDFQFEVTRGATLAGNLVYEDRTPVTPIPPNRMGVFLPNMGVYERGISPIGPNGAFTASGLPVGTWRLEFSAPVVIRSVQIGGRSFSGGQFELDADSGPALITISRAGASIQGSVELHELAKQFPRGMVTLTPVPLLPTDVPKRKVLEGKTAFVFEHLESGRYRVCAWVEEGAQVGALLGNPRLEQKFNALCETVVLSADERKNIRLNQISALELQ